MPIRLPRPAHLLAPVRLLPPPLYHALAAQAATQALRDALTDGTLAALDGRIIWIELHAPRLDLRLMVRGGRIRPAGRGAAAVTIRASAEDLLLVAAQRSDPDTLFFQRRLAITGDTALGLTVKNALDGIDRRALPAPLAQLLEALAAAVPEAQDSVRAMPGAPNQ